MTIQRSACLIFNPVAGQGDPEQDLLTIQSLLEPEIELFGNWPEFDEMGAH